MKDEDIILEMGGRSVGEILREAREQRGLSIEDIEGAIMIKARHVEAIEYDDHDELPGRVYAIGFVKAYSEYMGFDAEQMARLFKMKTIGRHATVKLESHGDVVTVSQTPSVLLIVSCVFVLCLLGVFVGQQSSQEVSELDVVTIPPVPEDLKRGVERQVLVGFKEDELDVDVVMASVQVKKETKTPIKAEKKSLAQPVNGDLIVIKAVYDAWINVKDSKGRSVYSGILQMGDTYVVVGDAGYRLMTGNAGGTELFIGGKSMGTLGRVSQVRKNIKLDLKALRKKN
ncbi:MAG: helix-turn-helix domain-containing protein [Alphaproteobacteria bacterium]|nr:helix-turn-helix domain-containing protein [Alphaproteobacteria bacterium]